MVPLRGLILGFHLAGVRACLDKFIKLKFSRTEISYVIIFVTKISNFELEVIKIFEE